MQVERQRCSIGQVRLNLVLAAQDNEISSILIYLLNPV
jgi:hypothetical protein